MRSCTSCDIISIPILVHQNKKTSTKRLFDKSFSSQECTSDITKLTFKLCMLLYVICIHCLIQASLLHIMGVCNILCTYARFSGATCNNEMHLKISLLASGLDFVGQLGDERDNIKQIQVYRLVRPNGLAVSLLSFV